MTGVFVVGGGAPLLLPVFAPGVAQVLAPGVAPGVAPVLPPVHAPAVTAGGATPNLSGLVGRLAKTAQDVLEGIRAIRKDVDRAREGAAGGGAAGAEDAKRGAEEPAATPASASSTAKSDRREPVDDEATEARRMRRERAELEAERVALQRRRDDAALAESQQIHDDEALADRIAGARRLVAAANDAGAGRAPRTTPDSGGVAGSGPIELNRSTARPDAPAANAAPEEVEQYITWAAGQYGADPAVLRNIARLESGIATTHILNETDSNARKGTPSGGMFQFIEPTFDWFAPLARAANPAAWEGLGQNDWHDWRQQALTTAWAIENGYASHWTTHASAERAAAEETSVA